jgi:hypothetical protein
LRFGVLKTTMATPGQQLTTAVLTSPRVQFTLSLWALGLGLLFLVPGLPVSERQLSAYHNALPPARDVAAEREAYSVYISANARYQNSLGWFWSCDSTCRSHKRDMEAAQAAYDGARARVSDAATAARGHLGLWSSYGVEAAKDVFWRSFNQAMAVAKNASFWDLIFYGVRAQFRDEGLAEFLLRMLFRVVR